MINKCIPVLTRICLFIYHVLSKHCSGVEGQVSAAWGHGLFSCRLHPNLHAVSYALRQYCCTADGVLTTCQSHDRVDGGCLICRSQIFDIFSLEKSRGRLIGRSLYTLKYTVSCCKLHDNLLIWVFAMMLKRSLRVMTQDDCFTVARVLSALSSSCLTRGLL